MEQKEREKEGKFLLYLQEAVKYGSLSSCSVGCIYASVGLLAMNQKLTQNVIDLYMYML